MRSHRVGLTVWGENPPTFLIRLTIGPKKSQFPSLCASATPAGFPIYGEANLVVVHGAHVAVGIVISAYPAVSENMVGIVYGRDGAEASFRHLVAVL